jgi:glycosyltransferase involved in cell wall biosynthesis
MSAPLTSTSPATLASRLQGGKRSTAGGSAAPLVSVISVVRNAQHALQATAESVLGQANAPLEYIVIDGASTDGTLDYVQRLDARIDYWSSEEDQGIYDAMNKGIRAARGQWIHFLNAGDVYSHPEFISGLAPHLSQNDKAIVFCPVALIDQAGRRKEHRGRKILYGGMPYCHQGIFFRRDLFESLGLFDLNYRICSDYDWLIRYFKTPGAGQLSQYSVRGQHAVIYDTRGVSTRSYQQRECEVREIVRRHYGLSWQWLRCYLVSQLRVAAKRVIQG